MDGRSILPLVPLHLTSLAILSPSNSPIYVRSFTGKQDELRHYHLSHAAVDVMEERSELASGCFLLTAAPVGGSTTPGRTEYSEQSPCFLRSVCRDA